MKKILWLLAFLMLLPATAHAQFAGADLSVVFRETDRTLPGGLYRIRLTTGQFEIDRNTAAAGNFSTLTQLWLSTNGISTWTDIYRGPDGSAAIPALSFSGDTDTGFYRVGSNEVGVSLGGTVAVQFQTTAIWHRSDSASFIMGVSGDVNITRDAANVLALKNSTTAQELRVYGTTTGSKYLSLSDDGSHGYLVAVGTSAQLNFGSAGTVRWTLDSTQFYPSADNSYAIGASGNRASNIFSTLGTFGIATNAAATAIYAATDSLTTVLFDQASADATASVLALRKSRGTQASRTIVSNNDALGQIAFQGIQDASTYRTAASIIAKIDAAPGATTDMPGRLEFYTTPDASVTPTLGLTIDRNQAATFVSTVSALGFQTSTNCSDSAGAAACGAAAAGSVVIDAASTSVVVSTTAVTANSQIFIQDDSGLSTRLSVTCNTQALGILGAPRVTARTAGTSFTVVVDVAPTTNPLCLSFSLVN